MKLLLPVLFIFNLASVVLAQAGSPAACPAISVEGPAGFVKPGETATYAIQIDSKDHQLNPQYLWSVSAGQILKGQGTTSVDVQQTIEALTVTVEVKGLPSGCPNSASATEIRDPAPGAVKLDEFTGSISKVDKNRLEHITEIMRKNVNGQLVIFVGYRRSLGSDERSSRRQDIIRNLDLFKDEDRRITFVDIGDDHEIVQFWLVPPGAEMPKCKECEEFSVLTEAKKCPSISVDGPVGVIPFGKPMVFTGLISNEARNYKTRYYWAVQGGKIVKGQGTLSTTVIQTDEGGNLTATLTVSGLPNDCFDNASATAPVCDCIVSTQVDEYESLSIEEEYEHIRDAAGKLKERPNDALFIIKYPGKSRRVFKQRIRDVKRFASDVVHLENPKFKIIVGPKLNRDRTKIYLVPPGAEEPVP